MGEVRIDIGLQGSFPDPSLAVGTDEER